MSEIVVIEAHAADVPLVTRLRGQSFIPGVHYAAQTSVWMSEAADTIEGLEKRESLEDFVYRQILPHMHNDGTEEYRAGLIGRTITTEIRRRVG